MYFDPAWNMGLNDIWSALALSQNNWASFWSGMPISLNKNEIQVNSIVVEAMERNSASELECAFLHNLFQPSSFIF